MTTRRFQIRPLLLVTIVTIVLAAIAAIVVALTIDDEAETTNFDTAPADVEGRPLAPLPETGTDPAIGQPATVISGQDRAGDPITAPDTDRPTILLFLAHWCPHCQREVPMVQSWIDDGQLPEGIDLVAVATSIDEARPNYPTSAWLDRENWTPPTIADAGNDAAQAYGLTGFPYWVAVDAEGRVTDRRSGELTLDQLTDLASTATATT